MSVKANPVVSRVLKFGGSSLGRAESLAQVFDIVAHEVDASPLPIVVSALGDTTDWLLEAVEAARAGCRDEATERVDRMHYLAVDTVSSALRARGTEWSGLEEVVSRELAPLRTLLDGIASVEDCSRRTRDQVLAFGELLSSVAHRSAPATRWACGRPAPRPSRTRTAPPSVRGGGGCPRRGWPRRRRAAAAAG